MSKLVSLSAIAVTMSLLLGCNANIEQASAQHEITLQSKTKHALTVESHSASCHMAWYEKVEKQVGTGDGQGHGPDLGSSEWRSVVEFKLGIRGNEATPSLDSELWCDYINAHYIKP